MTDQFDHASDLEQLARETALAETRQRAKLEKRPAAEGYCLSCFEDFPVNDNNRLFCDSKCAAAHTK